MISGLPWPTLGGNQLWADQYFYADWRIQRHVWTRRHRLLSPWNVQYAAGSYERCQEAFERIRNRKNLPPTRGEVVVLLHGLYRTRRAMQGLGRYLRREGRLAVVNLSYPSGRTDVATHAQGLARVLSQLPEAERIHFVGHSLGNIVVRQYLAMDGPDPRIGRMVMLAPPNQPPRIARVFGGNLLWNLVMGPAGRQLAVDSKLPDHLELYPQLATPGFDFAVLAGGRSNRRGRNPILAGDDDLIVEVEETRLAGAKDFAVMPVTHTFIMENRQVQSCVLHFLRHGQLFADVDPQPIGGATHQDCEVATSGAPDDKS